MLLTDFILSLVFINSNKLSKLNWPSEADRLRMLHGRLLSCCTGSFSGVSLAACFFVANDPFPFHLLLLLAESLLSSFPPYHSLPATVSVTSTLLIKALKANTRSSWMNFTSTQLSGSSEHCGESACVVLGKLLRTSTKMFWLFCVWTTIVTLQGGSFVPSAMWII